MDNSTKVDENSDNYTVMLLVLTFIILNATLLSWRNNDELTPIFVILSTALLIGSGYYIYKRKFSLL